MDNDAIDYFAYDNRFLSIKTFFSLKARKKMYSLFEKEIKPTPEDQILDLGATPDDKLADSNFFDRAYPYKKQITICSIEDCSDVVKKYGLKDSVINIPHAPLPFKDKQFKICYSSAVLEHVGSRSDQEYFINECLRVADKVFITTPYRFFPVEMHTFFLFLHWLPWGVFQRIVKKTKGDFWADINNLNLCSKRDIYRMRLDGSVQIRFIHTLLFRSNLVIIGSQNKC